MKTLFFNYGAGICIGFGGFKGVGFGVNVFASLKRRVIYKGTF